MKRYPSTESLQDLNGFHLILERHSPYFQKFIYSKRNRNQESTWICPSLLLIAKVLVVGIAITMCLWKYSNASKYFEHIIHKNNSKILISAVGYLNSFSDWNIGLIAILAAMVQLFRPYQGSLTIF